MMSKQTKRTLFKSAYYYIIELGLCTSLALTGYAWLYFLLTLFFMAIVSGVSSSKLFFSSPYGVNNGALVQEIERHSEGSTGVDWVQIIGATP